jgi:hypothetical protein
MKFAATLSMSDLPSHCQLALKALMKDVMPSGIVSVLCDEDPLFYVNKAYG